ncbi:MAG: leucine--tRNA ligase [Chloroflexi bacterium]|nr:leucine--tRNA ligase [Chloroflexota bacterium]
MPIKKKTKARSKVKVRARKIAPRRAATRKSATRARPARSIKTVASAPASNKYLATSVEPKWRARWEAENIWHVNFDDPSKKKFYFLTMYPYPSGDLHIGHWYAMAPSDAQARYWRMKGYNVFFPMGFDAFGLPAENAAIKHNINPYEWTMKNIENMRRQMRLMGASFDWEREVVTCDPRYYKWNQWFFIQMFKRGLAYKKMAAVDWCPKDQTVLAREQVIGAERACERCGTPVIKRDLEQWFLKITAYADELLDFSKLHWPAPIVTAQTNWIGRSEGVRFRMNVEGHDESFQVFTTRHDTVFGMTFAVLAPEHPLVEKITTPDQRAAVSAYVENARRQTEIDRLSTEKNRDGVFTGAFAINPMNNARVPIWIADYVLITYGTGAIMGVPGHDERDFEFAKRYGLEIPVVIAPPNWDGQPLNAAYSGEGTLVNSGEFNGMDNESAKKKIADAMQTRGIGERAVNYRIRDWLISRQRYWGTPIPIVYCPEHGAQPVPENELPVVLPTQDVEFMPTGESPLYRNEEFLSAQCPVCGKDARRETDTMDGFVDNSWYQYAYLDPYNTKEPINRELTKKWMPVDQYTGGVEHATGHLLYTRFWTKMMRDIGLVDFDEPMTRLFNQGHVLAYAYVEGKNIEDHGVYHYPNTIEKRADSFFVKETNTQVSQVLEKMSKSKNNGVPPDELVEAYGADTVRLHLMFMGPWEADNVWLWEPGEDWDRSRINGVRRWLNRVWNLVTENNSPSTVNTPQSEIELRRKTHQTIKRVTEDIEAFKFNTMLAAMMQFTNYLQKVRESGAANSAAWNEAIQALVLLIAPSAPHIAEEMWQRIGESYSVHFQKWPEWSAQIAAEEKFTLIVQVNGKVRDRIELAMNVTEAEVRAAALKSENVQKFLSGKPPRQVIYVAGRLVNIVV